MNFLSYITNGSERSIIVKKNIIGSLFLKGVSILISLLVVPMTIGYISSELYGVWLTISSILAWIHFMDVGFTLGLKNKLAEALAVNDYRKGKSLVSTTYFMMIVIFIPICLIVLFVNPHINWSTLLNVNSMYNTVIAKTISLLIIFVALQMIVNVFTAVVAAYQKVALSSSFLVLGQVFSLVIIYLLTLFAKPSLVYLAIAFSLIPVIVVWGFSIYFFRTKFKEVSPSMQSVKFIYVKELWGLGAKFFLIQIQVIVLYQTTNILISHIEGPLAVTQYNIAYKLLNVFLMAYTIILTPLWPAFTDAYTKSDYKWMTSIYKKMIIVFYVLCVGLFIVVLCSPYLYHIWVGERVKVPFTLTVCIAVYVIIYSWDSLQVQLLNGIGCVKLQMYVTLIGLVLHIPLSLLLGSYISFYGVVISMSIVNIIYSLFFTIQIRKILTSKATGIWVK